MDANEYQRAAHGFATYGHNPFYPVCGLSEEVGEVCGKIAKFIRKHYGAEPEIDLDFAAEHRMLNAQQIADNHQFREDLEKELGDVLWMVAEICSTYQLMLGVVMQKNIDKLTDRKKRGVIVGEGDNR